jgi:DNA-binding PadR family transcriptional regulator
MPRRTPPDQRIPLKNDILYILLVLRQGERHGYAIMQEASAMTDGQVRLQPGALYRHLKRLLDDGLIVESTRRRDPVEDERRRSYRLTATGTAVLAAEIERMAQVVETVRGAGAANPRPA